jgi:PKHD-type hydroxylase
MCGDMIQIADILTPEEARACRERLEAAGWADGRATAGHLAVHAKTNEQLPDDDPAAVEIADLVLARLGQNQHFIAATLPLRILRPRFNRYRGGGAYGEHIDNGIVAMPGTRAHIRSDLSATLFLSDPASYEGGELVSGGRRVKLPAGHLILYPAGTLHHVTPVTKGARIAAFFWIQSMIRADHRRAMLLDLDETIQAMRIDHPDHPSIGRLTGLYHNLLRDWAEV